jgi:hypothetical protein
MGCLVAGDAGLFNIVGSVGIGLGGGALAHEVAAVAGVRHTRGGGVGVLLAPKTGPVMLVFAAVMGLTFLSTVPPTAGLVARFFGPATWPRCLAW